MLPILLATGSQAGLRPYLLRDLNTNTQTGLSTGGPWPVINGVAYFSALDEHGAELWRSDGSAPCGPLRPASEIGHPAKGRIWLKVNGEVKQDGDLAQMIWNVPEVIVKLSEMVELAAGDIIMTGTPSGVAATVAGDKLECEIEGVGELTITIGPPAK